MYVGNPPREMMIFTGTALVSWESKAKLDRNEVVVLLPGLSTPSFQWTSTVSLASIANTDSEMIFAADESSVVLGPSGLELHVKIAVQGNDSVLNRISYHVQVLTDPVTAKVSGTIRWNRSLGDPTEAAKDPAKSNVSMFRVAAGNYVTESGSGPFGGPSKWIEVTSTFTTSAPVLAGDTWAVSYELDNVPLSQQFSIAPALLENVLTAVIANPDFTPAPRYVELTPNTPAAGGVDFELISEKGVR